MSRLSIKEVADEARKMAKFFRVFSTLEEVLDTLAMYDQLITERKGFSESLQKEIQNLSDKKAILIKGFDDDVYTARINSENAIDIYQKAQTLADEKIIALKKQYEDAKQNEEDDYQALIVSHRDTLNVLTIDIEKNSKLLGTARKALNAIKAKLE